MIYNQSLALFDDLYQLTMAYGYWKTGIHERRAVFNLFFRKAPFDNGFVVAAGLETAIDYIKNFKFDSSDTNYLYSLKRTDGNNLFEKEFLDYLLDLEFSCDICAVQEGKFIFPQEPLLTISGPLLQCQLLETPLLNILNFQSLIATKAYRVCKAAQGPVLEFGMRRAQGIDGALSASRAAYIGGCSATSNVLAGKLFDIPVKGTHAHSWVMSFDSESEAFDCYAKAMPNNAMLLVDTYDTVKGVCAAVETGKMLRRQGSDLGGIRLDSGDLSELSKVARKILDASGFQNTKIVASNDLDEYAIKELIATGAKIDVWGVGTKLVTAYDCPALGSVYKLGAIKDTVGEWKYKIKKSETTEKTTNPGLLQINRYYGSGFNKGDVIFNSLGQKPFKFGEGIRGKRINAEYLCDFCGEPIELLTKIFENGKLVYTVPVISKIREKIDKEECFMPNMKEYSVMTDLGLSDLKYRLLKDMK